MFRVDPKTVTRWAVRGWLPNIRTLGGHRRFPCDEVHRLLREGLPAEALEEQDTEDEQPPPAAATHGSQEGAAPEPLPCPDSGTADVSTTAGRHPINALIEDHFGGDAVAALLELAGRYGIAVAYLDRPWFTRYLGRALTADEWRRVAAELNDFCAVLDDLCDEDLEVYTDLVLHAAGVVGMAAPAGLIGDYEEARTAAGVAWTDHTAPAARPGQRADITDTADAVLNAPAISTEPTSGFESASRAEQATPDAGSPLPVPPPRPALEEPAGPQPPAARPASGTIGPHQLALSPAADCGQQAPSTAELPVPVEQVLERVESGESVHNLAQELGVPRNTLRGHLEAAAKYGPPPQPSQPNEEELTLEGPAR